MEERQRDSEVKLAELRELLRTTQNPAALYDAASRAKLALEFRASDAAVGLEPVEAAVLNDLRDLTEHVLLLAAEQKYPPACLDAAQAIWAERDDSRAPLAVRFAEQSDDPRAAYLLGLFAFHGFGCKKSLKRSFTLHKKAADAGLPEAMFELYVMTSQGLGCRKSEEDALGWCARAAEAGSIRAMANLGGFYATGQGVHRDIDKSIDWYERAALGGHGRAAATLGVMFALGQDVSRNPQAAREYFALAEEAGFDWRDLATRLGLEPEDFQP